MNYFLSPRKAVPANKRFSASSKVEAVELACRAFGIDQSLFTKKKLAEVLNTVSNVLHGTIELAAVKSDTLRSVCRAFNVNIPEDGDDETIVSLLEPRFYDAEDVRALMDPEIQAADLPTLLFWADALGLDVPDTSDHAQILELISIARHGPGSASSEGEPKSTDLSRKRRLDSDVLIDCATEDLHRIGVAVLGSEYVAVSRRQLIHDLRDKEVDESLLPEGFNTPVVCSSVPAPDTSSLYSATTIAADRSVLSSASMGLQLLGRSRADPLDSLFTQLSSLPGELHGKFVPVSRTHLKVGNVIVELGGSDAILFVVVETQPSVSIQSISDPKVTGCLVSTPQCWVATDDGLSVLKPLVQSTFNGKLVPATVYDLSGFGHSPNSAPSVLGLFRAAVPSAPNVVSSWNTRPPTSSHVLVGSSPVPVWSTTESTGQSGNTSDGFTIVRQERYEAARGFRTILGHNMSRFMAVTNNTGNCLDDRAYNNIIVDIHHDDRHLPALSRQQLKHLLTLQFVLSYDPVKPLGIHLQAFRAKGSAFQYNVQIQDALLKMVRILDTIRMPQGTSSRFFFTLFSPLIELLTTGDQMGLAMLPTSYVVEIISNILLGFGCKANTPAADSWTTADKQLQELAPTLVVDVPRHVNIASLRAMRTAEQDRNRRNIGRPPNTSIAGTGRGRNSKNTSGRGHSAMPRTTAPTGSAANGQSSSGSNSSARALCISALFEKYAMGSGCRKVSSGSCPFNHNIAAASKDDQRAAANCVSKEEKKRQLLEAIATYHQDALQHNPDFTPTSSLHTIDITPSSLSDPSRHPRDEQCVPIPPLLDIEDLVTFPTGTVHHAVTECFQLITLFSDIGGFPAPSSTALASLPDTVADMCKRASQENAISSAERDAAGFVFPSEVVHRDAVDLQRLGSLTALVRHRQDSSQSHRFNVVRCIDCFATDPEFATLLLLAREGAVIDTSPEFIPFPTPDPPRHLVSRLPHTLARHVFKLWSTGAVLVLPETVALSQPNVHLNNLHWCPKPGCPEGRLLGDCSNRELGNPLNSDVAKSAIEARYGSLHHPTIQELIQMIFRVASQAGGINSVSLWKEDISGAFGQYNHHCESAPLLSFPIGNGLIMTYLVGMFGWTGSPFVFGVFSRAFHRQCNSRIDGELDVYVDDFMGVSPSSRALADQSITQQFIRAACGDSAINLAKSMPPSRSAEFIGWLVDLDTATIRPNDKGIHKLVVSFFGIKLQKAQLLLHDYQVLASLACRYSQGLVGMRPFVQPLYAMTCGWNTMNSRGKKSPSSAAKLAIVMWRTAAIILLQDPSLLARPLTSLVHEPSAWQYYIISDAGPNALGVAVYSRHPPSCLAHVSYPLPYNAEESKFQNAREYHGLLLGELMLGILGIRHSLILWRGDNVSALTWARKNSCSSTAAQRAFIAYSWLTLMSGNELVDALHQAGSSMGDIDGLSRFRETAFSTDTDISDRLDVDDLFRLCDPTVAGGQLDDHLSCIRNIMRLLSSHMSLPHRP